MFTSDRQFTLQVLVNDLPLPEYPFQAEWFIEGMLGRKFMLRVGKTRRSRRAVVVVSVDGLSIMDGKPAKASGSGYIIEAGIESFDIPGWRLNDQEVAAFVFSSLPEAYASQMGKPTNIGVIGATFFYEQVPEQSQDSYGAIVRPLPPSQLAPPGSPAPALPGLDPFPGWAPPGSPAPALPRSHPFPGATPSAPGVGTGFGSRQSHRVWTASFERDLTTAQTLLLRYDTAANLVARGIVLDEGRDRVLRANPFPGDAGCTPPPGWTGE